MLTRKGQDLLGLGALMLILALASVVAIAPIRVSQQPVDIQGNPRSRSATRSASRSLFCPALSSGFGFIKAVAHPNNAAPACSRW